MQLGDALRNCGLKATSKSKIKKKKKKQNMDELMAQWNKDPEPTPNHRLRKGGDNGNKEAV